VLSTELCETGERSSRGTRIEDRACAPGFGVQEVQVNTVLVLFMPESNRLLRPTILTPRVPGKAEADGMAHPRPEVP
jgi:hypothetical protein